MVGTRAAAVALVTCALASCGPKSAVPGATLKSTADDPQAPRRLAYVVTETPGSLLTATDAQHLYWVDEAGLKRRAHGGADQKAELVSAKLAGYPAAGGGAFLVVGKRGYLFAGLEVISIALDAKNAEPEVVVQMPTDINAFTIAPDGEVYIASAGQVLEVAAGKQPRVLASDQGTLNDVIADDKFVYFGADAGTPAGAPPASGPYYTPYDTASPTPQGTLSKVPRDGGKVTALATKQTLPGTLGLHDGRLWWVSDGTPAVASVSIDGGDVRAEAPGRAETMVIDAGGLVYRHVSGMIVERRADQNLQVAFVPDATWTMPGQLALSPEWIYVTATRAMSGTPAILAVPRQHQAVQLAFATSRTLGRMRVDDGAVYWTERAREDDGRTLIMRGDPDTGDRKQLGDYEGYVIEMAIGGGQVYFDDNSTISQVAIGGGEIRTYERPDSGWLTGLTVHRNHVYWMDGSALYARKRKGGAPFTVARNDNYYGYGYYGDGGGDLVFDDDFVYTTGFGQGGTAVYRISERGQIKPLWEGGGSIYPGKDLILLGDELFFTAGQGGPIALYKLTLDGEATQLYNSRGDGYSTELTTGAGLLYLLTQIDAAYEIARIDPTTGDATVVLRINNYDSSGYSMGEMPTLTADDRAVYLAYEMYDAIFEVAHDAPAVPDLGWPAVVE